MRFSIIVPENCDNCNITDPHVCSICREERGNRKIEYCSDCTKKNNDKNYCRVGIMMSRKKYCRYKVKELKK